MLLAENLAKAPDENILISSSALIDLCVQRGPRVETTQDLHLSEAFTSTFYSPHYERTRSIGKTNQLRPTEQKVCTIAETMPGVLVSARPSGRV